VVREGGRGFLTRNRLAPKCFSPRRRDGEAVRGRERSQSTASPANAWDPERGAAVPSEATPAGVDRDSVTAMPRSFDFSIESPASVEQIHSAFAEEDYWLARLAAYGGGISKLDSLIIGTDGSVAVVIVQDAGDQGLRLPKLIARFYPRTWRVVHKETWSSIDGGLVRGEVSIATQGAPGSGFGTALLEPAQKGSRLDCTATVEFKVPLVGGKVESLIGRQLAKQFSVILRFTAKWITEHA
jgi:Protein of unknown function (DUF2505)